MIRAFFRIVATDPPTERDFYSYERLGISVTRPTAKSLRLMKGISVYSSLERAVRQPRQYPHLGSFIAIMEVEDELVLIEQTGKDPEHHTIWFDPVALLSTVVATTRT
jgi:hypothetical protein